MKLLLRLYSIYAMLVFLLTCLAFVPMIILLAWLGKTKSALWLNRSWSWVYFKLLFVRIRFRFAESKPENKQYIICANHFSYMDIPIIAGLPVSFKFIGKHSVTSVPVFGYMFKKLHITVNRSSARSRAQSMVDCRQALQQGFSITFFPEGGIVSTSPPHMVAFKDGAFRLAVEAGVPILPVAMPHNHILLPDDNSYLFRPTTCEVRVLEAIHPAAADNDPTRLKEMVWRRINEELMQQRNNVLPVS